MSRRRWTCLVSSLTSWVSAVSAWSWAVLGLDFVLALILVGVFFGVFFVGMFEV